MRTIQTLTRTRFNHNCQRYIVALNPYSYGYLVWATCEQDAIDEAADSALEEHGEAFFATDMVNESYNEAIANGKTEDEAAEDAQADMCPVGGYGHYLPSWEVSCREIERADVDRLRSEERCEFVAVDL